ncbi:serine/threonine-protein phosphatase [Streptomyces yangpuensis]|uniref:Serine/threonine-protein phosphatase n=1 Tax=Streptomyces yangpuensis TaxID=1648182 RepID=A0ABY5Q6A5_9ACTN|nr:MULTISPECIES: PP2C family protein-serine/threonine phosphatase [Streptomyces]MBZ9593673.1 serine/threonine-protein phosphatase [Streptomyces erythrochromogenes]UUY51780.1 serine/threonine-protein phosphatase [Streptomyces yangpuensis]
MLVADAGAVVVHTNEAAGLLFPDARPGSALADAVPGWLASAHARHTATLPAQRPPAGSGTVQGPVGDRSYEAHPTPRDDGTVVWWLLDDTDHRLAREALRAERERTEFLVRSSNLLLSSLNLDRCMDVTAQMAADHLADAALVIAPAHGRELPIVSCVRGGGPSVSRAAVDPEDVPGLAEALQGFPPVPSRWLDPSAAPAWLVPDGLDTLGSIVITPLPGHGVPAGALVLLRSDGAGAFTEGEEVFARLFAARAGAAMSAARLYAEQASITDTLMRELLPPSLHQVSGVEYAGGYRPSKDHERVGGDFYDVHPAAEEGAPSLVVLGDVCGKGLEAAVMTGKIRNTLHALLPMADDHHRMLSLLNTSLLNSDNARFATMVLASAARDGNTVRLRLTSAGHPAPLILRSDGRVEEAPTKGTLVGALPEIISETARVTLAPGDTCVLYTDGISEARGGPMGGAMFGEERLRRALSQCAAMPAEAVVEHVQMLTAQWVGTGRHDDMAVVVISAPRTNHLSAVDGHTRGRFTA